MSAIDSGQVNTEMIELIAIGRKKVALKTKSESRTSQAARDVKENFVAASRYNLGFKRSLIRFFSIASS